MITTTIEVMIT